MRRGVRGELTLFGKLLFHAVYDWRAKWKCLEDYRRTENVCIVHIPAAQLIGVIVYTYIHLLYRIYMWYRKEGLEVNVIWRGQRRWHAHPAQLSALMIDDEQTLARCRYNPLLRQKRIQTRRWVNFRIKIGSSNLLISPGHPQTPLS
jgi:hypothetical protein